MKIIYCIVGTFKSGGMERVLANKANFLVKLGHAVTIATTDQKGRKPYFDLDSRIVQTDLGIHYTNEAGKGLIEKSAGYFIRQRRHKKRLTVLLKRIKPDIVISMFDHDASFLYSINDGSKKVLEIHFSRFKRLQYGRKGLWKWVDGLRSKRDMLMAKRYDRFVVLTEEDRSYWGNLTNIQVIPNANSFQPETTAALTAKRVLAVGRLDYQKGFDELILAWKYVNAVRPDWTLAIFGEGPTKKDLQKLIQQLGLQSAVQLSDPVWAIETEYMESSILAMTSRYEGLPMVLLEAQACGLPLVAYRCKCGPADIITNGRNGFLVDEGDQDAFAKRLIQLIEDSDLRHRMGRESLLMSARFAEEVVMKQWTDLLETLLTERP